MLASVPVKLNTVRALSFLVKPFSQDAVIIVLDLASRFADGRLSTQKLVEADDEELARLLIEVRGIGRVCNYSLNCW